jgi:integrase
MCFTGLAHADVSLLSYEHIKIGVDGKRWLEINRQKTGVLTLVPLLPVADEILRKYLDDSKCLSHVGLLPIPCVQVFNRNISLLMKAVGVNKKISSHSCRYTFASTILMGTGIPLEIAGKMLGHASLRSTQHYSKLSEKRIADAIVNLDKMITDNIIINNGLPYK